MAVPKIFWDEHPRIVARQLERLETAQLLALLAVELSPKEIKYRLGYEKIIIRPEITRQTREECAQALAGFDKKSISVELLEAIGKVKEADLSQREKQSVEQQLQIVLFQQSQKTLAKQKASFVPFLTNKNPTSCRTAFAALIVGGHQKFAWQVAQKSATNRQHFLEAIPLLTTATTDWKPLIGYIISSLAKEQPVAVRQAAIRAVAFLPSTSDAYFKQIAPFITLPKFRDAAVGTLTKIPDKFRSVKASRQIVNTLIGIAEKTPAAKRTAPNFLNAMALADQLLRKLPLAESRPLTARFRKIVVRVIRINTIHDEMKYDVPFFVAEAGEKIQIVLHNDDIMQHNLVIVNSGKLKEVAMQAAVMSSAKDKNGFQYVPKSKDILQATRMVPSHKQIILTFTVPKKSGEYPYVCTFPNHWPKMYGVMHVVDSLEKWAANPTYPRDPITGISYKDAREEHKWVMNEFPKAELTKELAANRDLKNGQRIFITATCSTCHQIGDVGKAVGPDLTTIWQRHKTNTDILHEIIDPSHKINPKFVQYMVLDINGKQSIGVLVKNDDDVIVLRENNGKLITIKQDDVDGKKRMETSMMPKGLLNKYTKKEIYDLIAYINSTDKKKNTAVSKPVSQKITPPKTAVAKPATKSPAISWSEISPLLLILLIVILLLRAKPLQKPL